MTSAESWIKPVTLEGRFVRLEPLEPRHYAGLFSTLEPQELRFIAPPTYWAADSLGEFIESVAWPANRIPFAVVSRKTGEVVGCTSFFDANESNRGVEIGGTWIHSSQHGGATNPEMKLLMLEHAFETRGAIRVQFKTHHENLRSQQAITKLGATREGTLRNHVIYPDGSRRHSVFFSILDSEWPEVKARLLERLAKSYEF